MGTKVKKSHHFIASRMSLSPREQDLLSLIFVGLKREEDKIKFGNEDANAMSKRFKFSTGELIEFFNLSRQALYITLDEATKHLISRVVEIKNTQMEYFERISFCSYAEFRNGVLTLDVGDEAIKYMLDYSKGFAEVDLKLLLSLRGGYEKRILELVSRFKINGYTTTLGEFCKMVGADYKNFNKFNDFKKTVIQRPILNIVKKSYGIWEFHSDLASGFSLKRIGKKYTDTDKIIIKLKYNLPDKKETNKINKQKQDNKLVEFIDYLASRINKGEASKEEALAFISITKEGNTTYNNSFMMKAKKIAEIEV
ncbi:MAG: replication initiation protein [Candidatus Arsenophonus phytopathogenicus]